MLSTGTIVYKDEKKLVLIAIIDVKSHEKKPTRYAHINCIIRLILILGNLNEPIAHMRYAAAMIG